MRKKVEYRLLKHVVTLTTLALISLVPCVKSYGEGTGMSFLYNLSDFGGTVPLNSPKLFADSERREIFVLGEDSSIRIFNHTGMETYRFNDDGSLGNIVDLAVNKDGNILLLALSYNTKFNFRILKCDFRGEPRSTIEVKGVSGDFRPNGMAYRNGRLYFVDRGSMKVVVTDEEGRLERSIDLYPLLQVDAKKKKSGIDLSGFSVDREGNILFTIPVLFHAYRLSPDGKLDTFGQSGSTPGRFNIAAGIVADDEGRYFVSDKLKCAILIFDKDFNFITQIGYRGYGPGGLIVPMEMAILNDKLYVSQGARRGVSVFSINR